jgi:N-acetyl sugar amidotransferase
MAQICSRCVMDTSAPNIEFNELGVCNFCRDYESRCNHVVFETENNKITKRKALFDKIKKDGKGKRYDCIIGVSGGIDSSYVLHLAIKEGLRPLAVHMDNNWNSELAVNNINNLISASGVDLHTHVIDWPEYRALMQSFFDADVIDVELLYDNAMTAVNYNYAKKYGIKYILSGSNLATEGVDMPKGWSWIKTDARNIRSIAKIKNVKIKSFPIISTLVFAFNRVISGISWVSILDLYDYNKNETLKLLEESYSYKKYPYKHYESIFTRFYQGYILPKKFGVDKRKLHLSTLIMSKQMSRESALIVLEADPYPELSQLNDDLEYFLKKMQWSRTALDAYIKRPAVPHDSFDTEILFWSFLRSMNRFYRMLTNKST